MEKRYDIAFCINHLMWLHHISNHVPCLFMPL